MKANVVLAGVGGQGVLSIAACLGQFARSKELHLKQAEVHGMAQRGGAVMSHLRISDELIHSDLIACGTADLILSVEPLEALRHIQFLRPGGAIVTSSAPVTNIPDYPDLPGVLSRVATYDPHILVDAGYWATVAGSGRAANMVVLGAGGWRLGLAVGELEAQVHALFIRKSERIAQANCKALRLGVVAARAYAERVAQGVTGTEALASIAQIAPAEMIELAEAEALDQPLVAPRNADR
ncbi:MAG: indolepyruvate oxidoreductase subunit beta [bacterium]|nr:indolepyruvate oxidoreductase subunit beta [bacterium]